MDVGVLESSGVVETMHVSKMKYYTFIFLHSKSPYDISTFKENNLKEMKYSFSCGSMDEYQLVNTLLLIFLRKLFGRKKLVL